MNKMKGAMLGAMLMCCISLVIPLSHAAEPELGGGRVTLVQGQVLIQTKDEEEWAEAFVNFPIIEGDRIVTEREARVELQFRNGTYVRVGEISQLDVIALGSDRGKPFIHLYQSEGIIYVNHRFIEEASSIYIDLPYGVLSSYVPSRFRIDLTPSEVRISVLEGNLEFKRDGKSTSLTQGKTLIAKEVGVAEGGQLYRKDEWDQWNEARDQELFQRRYAQKYLPPELEFYGYEMEGNGRWIYTPEYQYVWVPTVVVGWSPFQSGYWAWRSGVYCWVPRESWGWVPFHYGRWVHMRNHGWVWVPPSRQAVVWNPGAVAWHNSTTFVSWVPLAPGEIYYGPRSYGPNSLNINQVNITMQKNLYINAQIKNAVVTVPKDSFFRKSPVRITQVANPFLNPVKVSGPPTERPVSSEGKRAPSRFMNEPVEKVSSEKKLLTKEVGRDSPSLEKSLKVVEQKRITKNPEKKIVNEITQNRSVRTVTSNPQTNSLQGNSVKKDSASVTTGEKVTPIKNSTGFDSKPSGALNTTGVIPKSNPTTEQRGIISNGVKGENKVLTSERDKDRNVPVTPPVTVKTLNAKEPKFSPAVPEKNVSLPLNDGTKFKTPNSVSVSPPKNTSVNLNQNRSERTAQPSAQPSRPSQIQPLSQSQQGKAFVGKTSLPEVRSSSASVSKGQAAQPNRGSTVGILGTSPLKSFR